MVEEEKEDEEDEEEVAVVIVVVVVVFGTLIVVESGSIGMFAFPRTMSAMPKTRGNHATPAMV